jgi:hypothetical protein
MYKILPLQSTPFTADGVLNACTFTLDSTPVVSGGASGRVRFLRLVELWVFTSFPYLA